MVATLVSLKFQLLRNSFKRSVGQLIGLIIGGLYGLGVLLMLGAGLVALSFADADLARTILVLAGAAVILGWALIPVLASGVDMTLDPQRFVLYGIPIRKLMAGMAAAALVGIPGIITTLLLLGSIIPWLRSAGAAIAAVIGAILALASVIIYSRTLATVGSNLSNSRRYREIGAVVIFIPLVLLGPIFAGVTNGLRSNAQYLPELARYVAWTPFGAPWALPSDVYEGNYGFAALRILITLALLAISWVVWENALTRSMITPPHNVVAKRAAGKLGFFGWVPDSPSWAVFARAATYWIRDPRYAGSLVVIPLLPIMFLFASGFRPEALSLLLILGPMTAFIMAWSISADVSYDNTAFALHVATGVPGKADRWGRVMANAAITVPILIIFVVGSIWVSGKWELLAGLTALTAAVVLNGWALSSVVSARYITPVPKPGESPFKSPAGGKGLTLAVQGIGMLVMMAISLPQLVLFLVELFTGNHVLGWINLTLGVALAAFLLWLGVRIGGKDIERRGPELLQQVIQSD